MSAETAHERRQISSPASYFALGRSGLRVSPLCLGTMTFGDKATWGCPDMKTIRAIFDRYLEAGGNFLDTADMYQQGQSEELLGKFAREAGNRDSLVIATKFTFNQRPGDPNAGGNGRKHIMEACEASLRRLQTDHIDLYWLHAWDTVTPAEEVMSTLDTLVRAGKVRHIGLSDIPAWYLARAQTLAELRGWERLCAIQLEYSLVMRNIEHEYVDAAHELGLGITPWSPLGGGILTGKYRRTQGDIEGEGRLQKLRDSANPVFDKLTERNFRVVDVLLDVANDLGRSPAQVALNWVTRRPGVVSTIIGATRLEQLEDNLAALEFDIPEEHLRRLDEASRPAVEFPYIFYEGTLEGMVTGGTRVQADPPWYR